MIAATMDDEWRVRTRERALAKARRVAWSRREARTRRLERDRQRFVVWIAREREAFAAHVTEPESTHLRRVWLRVLGERPPLYGHKEARHELPTTSK